MPDEDGESLSQAQEGQEQPQPSLGSSDGEGLSHPGSYELEIPGQ